MTKWEKSEKGGVLSALFRRSRSLNSSIQYLRLHECPRFSMGVFAMPEGAVIPLHNHPHMTVMSKLLYGSVHVRSFDWVDRGDEADVNDASTYEDRVLPGPPRLARLVTDRRFEVGDPHLTLYPSSGGNLHCLTAVTDTALLDVLAPPYALGRGRNCHYFMEVSHGPNGELAGDGEAWLVEVEESESFSVTRGVYSGPKFGSEAGR